MSFLVLLKKEHKIERGKAQKSLFFHEDLISECASGLAGAVSNFMMRILHLLLLLLPLNALTEEEHEEDYGGDAQDAYADSQESEEKREEEKLKAKKKEDELEEKTEGKRKKFLEILSYIQRKEQDMEATMKTGHKKFQNILSHISGLIENKKYMDFKIPKKVKIETALNSCTNELLISSFQGSSPSAEKIPSGGLNKKKAESVQ